MFCMKNMKQYSNYSDLKVVFIERLIRPLLHIINKPLFINGDGDWVNILNDAIITYNNNIHSTINMTPIGASNNPDILYLLLLRVFVNLATPNQRVNLATPNLKSVIMSGMLTNVTFSLKVTLLTGIEN